MLAPTQPIRPSAPVALLGFLSFFTMGFYLGLLFAVGALASTIVAGVFFKGKLRWLLGFGGGFFGLAGWFNLLMNYKDQYERVVAFVAQFVSENWAYFVCDSVICCAGALVFVSALGFAHKGTKKAGQMMLSSFRNKKTEETSESEKTEDR